MMDTINKKSAENKIIANFLSREENKSLYDKVISNPLDTGASEKLNESFIEYFGEIRLVNYFASLIEFSSINYSKKNRETEEKLVPIIFENDAKETNSNEDDYSENNDLLEVIGNESLYIALTTLTDKEKLILKYLVIDGYEVSYISKKTNTTKQSVSKTKIRALNKLKKLLVER
ncbi:sigma-70 family RNA polymerase sigma factor [Brevibacillus laterosporus]|uniref:sigma-70 family RNA polymerase sigma factor n=1 Tax=Brevibacillus laterosporus TaxID=1465 RepID=UPI00240747D0|nr:sigma-70 family RNA polymerase sigma factor [Brevibacillus laterosporus]MDF9412403.1 sigma-70 family RNA polymerase sigma factor [Brevibacillus laterosporus]